MNAKTLLNPRLKSIVEFLDGKHHFVIPWYQRGYRWEERQVKDLLNDILEFQEEIKQKECDKKGEFYCLQPIVVLKTEDGKWEVIDGQQRLTTILILLSRIKPALEALDLPTSFFSMEYETREKEEYSSRKFLEKISSVTEIDKKNIDFYRMSQAYLTIDEWWKSNKKINELGKKGQFYNTLLGNEIKDGVDIANNVRFIWYEIDPEGDKPSVAFTKYNQGKIELTNTELIKAIFYLSDNSINDREKKKYQLKIGYEWDDIENTLRKENFWKFINPTNEYTNHIEFIFEIIANKYIDKVNVKLDKNIDRLWSFIVFNELITKNINIGEGKYSNTRDFLWNEVKTYYRTFVEWYNNNTYYHLIGFLLQIGKDIETIKTLSEKNTKKDFEKELKGLIKDHFKEVDFEQLGYDSGKDKAKKLLLLFNVVTTMNSRDNRFAFDKYSTEKWSLEHIHAQQSEELKSEPQKRQLLEEQKAYFSNHENQKLLDRVNNLLMKDKINQEEFNEVQKEIFAEFSDANEIHSISNLALLTVPDNSSLNNNIFPIKRDLIKELDKKGSFIPICTKNVFLKYYSKNVGQNVKWDRNDMLSYLDEMKEVLNDYIKVKENEY